MSQVRAGILVGTLLAGSLQGCSISPAEEDAIRRAWEDRDAERAAGLSLVAVSAEARNRLTNAEI